MGGDRLGVEKSKDDGEARQRKGCCERQSRDSSRDGRDNRRGNKGRSSGSSISSSSSKRNNGPSETDKTDLVIMSWSGAPGWAADDEPSNDMR